ncbi:MAG: hypothetical protein ABEL97_07160 [Salinibacter sp.]
MRNRLLAPAAAQDTPYFDDVSDRLPARTVANDVEAGDVNSDGHPDLVVSNTGASDPGETPPDWQTVQQNFLWLGRGGPSD